MTAQGLSQQPCPPWMLSRDHLCLGVSLSTQFPDRQANIRSWSLPLASSTVVRCEALIPPRTMISWYTVTYVDSLVFIHFFKGGWFPGSTPGLLNISLKGF